MATLKRIVDTSSRAPLVSPALLARALGAEPYMLDCGHQRRLMCEPMTVDGERLCHGCGHAALDQKKRSGATGTAGTAGAA